MWLRLQLTAQANESVQRGHDQKASEWSRIAEAHTAAPLAIALWRILLHAHSSVHILQVYLRDSAAAAKTFGGGVPAALSDFLGVPSEQQQAAEKVAPNSPKSVIGNVSQI